LDDGVGRRFAKPLEMPLLATALARSSRPELGTADPPDPRPPEYSAFCPPALAGAPGRPPRLRFEGTVWMVPQCWHRQTPPAKASSISITVWHLVQVSVIIRPPGKKNAEWKVLSAV
jgi:hypothetical protein